jgi:putative transposase
MFTAYKYKLLPTKDQATWLNQVAGQTRWLWNYMLDLNKKEYEANKKFVFLYDMAKQLPELKKQHEWLKQAPSQSLQQRCMDLDAAIKSVWKSDFGFPQFKSKHKSKDGFRIPQAIANGKDLQIKATNAHIQLPKIGKIKWKYHRELIGKIKSVTISRDLDSWYISVLQEIPDIKPELIDRDKVIGIDLGITHFATMSDGTKITSPNFLKQKLKKLKKYQRQYAKKKSGSNNQKKARYRVAKTHQEIRFQRNNWLHQTSRKLVNQYDLICLEDLKTKSLLTKSKQAPLNRAISDQGWYMFTQMLAYKAKHSGKHVTKIDQWAPSSKTCSNCGHKVDKMTLDMRNWTCPNCNQEHDRDLNAALNIKFWGIMATDYNKFVNTDGMSGINACGDTSTEYCGTDVQVSLKQEAYGSLVHT